MTNTGFCHIKLLLQFKN